jgi:tetratricopeptide (TPR) repeat protein
MYAGQSNQLLGQYEEALAHYDVAIKKNDSNGLIYYNRGLT